MIDVKELRIGNYVFPKNDSGKESVIGEIFAINDYLVSKSRCFFHRQKYESMQCVCNLKSQYV